MKRVSVLHCTHLLFIPAGHAAALEDEVNSLWIGSLDGDEPVELMHTVSNAAYAMGHLFYLRDQLLIARPFDPAKQQFTGEPRGYRVPEQSIDRLDPTPRCMRPARTGPIERSVFGGEYDLPPVVTAPSLTPTFETLPWS